MKHSLLFFISVFLLSSFSVFSQGPSKINFQAILRNTSGDIVSNQAVGVRMSIKSGTINYSSLYVETHAKTTDVSGLINIQLGTGTVISGIFGDIEWGSGSHFIQLEVDFNGGSNYVVIGTQELISVPYALYANKTDTSVLNLRNRFSEKVNVGDTSNMLTNYRTGLNGKVSISDTSNMLFNYRTGLTQKVNLSDTTLMLEPYLQYADTTNMLVPYLRDADTTNMLVPYLRDADTTNMLIPYLLDSDTTNMLVPYLRDADTTNMLVPYLRDADTTSMLVPYLRDADTTNMLNSYFKKSDTTSLNLTNRFNEKLNVTDFPSGATTGNIMFYNGTSWVNLAPGSPGQSLIISSNGLPTWGCIITNTAGTASSTPTLNVYSSLNPITHSTSGATGIGTATGLPSGVSASWAANVITISGTPSSAGSFTYTIPLTGGCGSVNATGSMTVNASVATLTTTSIGSITSTDASSGGNITFVDGGEITARGVVWSTSSGPTVSLSTKTTDGTGTGTFTSTISGLSESTTYYVRAYATNTAGTAYGNEVTFITTCTLNTAGTASSTPTLNAYSALTPITISTTGATGIGTPTGLPTGVTASWAANTITISGIPSVTGTFTYTIPLTGGCGSGVNATGTITVNVFTCATNSFSDIDGNTYNTVSIGNQCWMSENLKTSRYRNGDLIPIVTDNTAWGTNLQTAQTGKRSWYDNDSTTYENRYGNLYNWYAVVDSRGLCPTGWHVSSDDEWKTLTDINGVGSSEPGRKLKSTVTNSMQGSGLGWDPGNPGTDNYGFSAFPGGLRSKEGVFNSIRIEAFFWCATQSNPTTAWGRYLWYNNTTVYAHDLGLKEVGASVRCLKDN